MIDSQELLMRNPYIVDELGELTFIGDYEPVPAVGRRYMYRTLNGTYVCAQELVTPFIPRDEIFVFTHASSVRLATDEDWNSHFLYKVLKESEFDVLKRISNENPPEGTQIFVERLAPLNQQFITALLQNLRLSPPWDTASLDVKYTTSCISYKIQPNGPFLLHKEEE